MPVIAIIDRYRLKVDVLEAYLNQKFGTKNIRVQEREDDDYAVELPRDLSEQDKEEIKKLRGKTARP
ncbi:hypothetical protein VM1G_03215 [Cytospora mali]|uniref:Uncharacterized protein n=1 Tax=Cytospora mali TaxID=578113 RepID=A0A194VTJ8_CYTMA|nr:hypothetical protein VM1G_03215 [Valsa mali]